jgi:hypothetical protein
MTTLLGLIAACSAASLISAPLCASSAPTPVPVNVLTFHNNNARTGHNPHERVLSQWNVRPSKFGKLFSYPVDGYLYAQPLYASAIEIPGQGTHNVVYAASEHDSVYAFDADGLSGTPVWHQSFIDPASGITTVDSLNDLHCDNLVPEVGITGTPVISLENQALYVVSETRNQNTGEFILQLHALDLATGAEKFGGPMAINAIVPGTGNGNDGTGHVPFAPMLANQRSALLLQNGVVYVAFASNCDSGPYHGWVIAYDARTLAQRAVFNSTPNGAEGGIWQSGNGPAASAAGMIFVGIGNGSFDGKTEFGESYVKLDPKTLRVKDYFSPSNESSLSNTDEDAGTPGALIVPTQASGPAASELVGGVKTGRWFLINRAAMGKFCDWCANDYAVEVVNSRARIFDAPAFAFGMLYGGGAGAHLKGWQLVNGMLSPTAVVRSSNFFGYPGASPSISSAGSIHRLVWALDVSGYASSAPAVLHAYWAPNLAELYSSAESGARDTAGPAVKFTVPTIANGKVYVGTQIELDAYGLLPPAAVISRASHP